MRASRAPNLASSSQAAIAIYSQAAKEIARQLRLRQIGGIVVIDFIDLKATLHRRQVGEAMRHAVAGDWERYRHLWGGA